MKPYEPKKRWLQFYDQTKPDKKTKNIVVGNGQTWIGNIKWKGAWRQYVFDDGDLELAEGCLYELFEKVRELRLEREKK